MQPSFLQRYLAAFGRMYGWFSFDAALLFMAYNQLLSRAGTSGDTLEIGVYHGLSSICVAALRSAGRKFYAIDLFEELGTNDAYGPGASYRKIFEDNIQSMHGTLDFVVPIATASSNLKSANFTPSFSFCHVDGGHSPKETFDDLKFASDVLLPGGLLALDDYFNPQHPGVCEGAVDFMRHHEGVLTPLAIGFNKATFQKQPAPAMSLNSEFGRTFAQVRHRETTMWGVPVFLFDTPLRAYFDLYASTPERLVPLGEAGVRAFFSTDKPMVKTRRGKSLKLPITVKNVSAEPFPAGESVFGLSYHLLSHDGLTMQHDNARSDFAEPLQPGAEIKLKLNVTAPSTRGRYQLEIDLVWEGVMWFKDAGNPALLVALEVR